MRQGRAEPQDGDSRPWSQISQENLVKIARARDQLRVAAPRRCSRKQHLASNPPRCKASSQPLAAAPCAAPARRCSLGAQSLPGEALFGATRSRIGRRKSLALRDLPSAFKAHSRRFAEQFDRRGIHGRHARRDQPRRQKYSLRPIDARESEKDTLHGSPVFLDGSGEFSLSGQNPRRFRLRLREQ